MGSSKLGMARFWPSVKNEEPKLAIPKIINMTDYEDYASHETVLKVTFKDNTTHYCEARVNHKCHELMAQWAKSGFVNEPYRYNTTRTHRLFMDILKIEEVPTTMTRTKVSYRDVPVETLGFTVGSFVRYHLYGVDMIVKITQIEIGRAKAQWVRGGASEYYKQNGVEIYFDNKTLSQVSMIGPSESEEMKLHDLLFCK